MNFFKTYPNGIKLVVNKIEGILSVSCGIMVKTGSVNEKRKENGISHFIEHNLFKGTTNRTAFEISDGIDSIGAQINAFTSKEMTCYYTKSTSEHFVKCFEILSDIFCNSIFDQTEIEKEKGVVIEEINMSEDTPEELCLDLLAKSSYGLSGIGQTILGSAKNVKNFSRQTILDYMSRYYTPENIVVSIAGNIEINKAVEYAEKFLIENFKKVKGDKQVKSVPKICKHLYKYKKIEQTHIGFSMPGLSMFNEEIDALSIANVVFGGGMSSRLFQKIREELGLAYSVYSYVSQYKDSGVIEIYAGVNTDERDKATKAILNELCLLNKNGITKKEFERGKEQIKSSLILGQESSASQMILYGKYLLYLNKEFDFEKKVNQISQVSIDQVNDTIKRYFVKDNLSTSTIGPNKKPLDI